MRTFRSNIRMTAAALALNFGLAGLTLTAAPVAVFAQTRGPVQRTVKGRVQDKNGAGVKGAVVYLKDGHTSSVKSAISDDDGSYRFVQLSQNTDYELWAKLDDRKSPTKAISSFDSKNEYNIDLKLD